MTKACRSVPWNGRAVRRTPQSKTSRSIGCEAAIFDSVVTTDSDFLVLVGLVRFVAVAQSPNQRGTDAGRDKTDRRADTPPRTRPQPRRNPASGGRAPPQQAKQPR